jgi:hypothetical protein
MLFRTLVVVSSLVVLPVAAAAQVRVDFDRQTDFGRYKTFDVQVGPLVRADGAVDELNTLTESRLRRAVASELSARGLEATDVGADLVVRVSSRDAERTEIVSSGLNSYPRYYWRPYRYGRSVYWRAYPYWDPYYNDVWTRRFLEGSLTVDAIERDSGRLVYRAQVSGEVGKDPEKYVMKAMDRAFKKFPVKELAN